MSIADIRAADTSGRAPDSWGDAAGPRPLTSRPLGGPYFESFQVRLDLPTLPLHSPSARMPFRFIGYFLRQRCGRGEDLRPGELDDYDERTDARAKLLELLELLARTT